MCDRTEDFIATYSRLMNRFVIRQDVNKIENCLNKGFPINSRLKKTGAFDNFPTEVEHRHFVAEALTRSRISRSSKEMLKAEKTTTLLHLAIRSQSYSVVRLLLERGADVNSPMEGGETPLMIAVITKQNKVIKMLIDKGANVEAETLWGKRALHYAARYGNTKASKLLVLYAAADADAGYLREDQEVMPRRAPSAESLVAVESLADSEESE